MVYFCIAFIQFFSSYTISAQDKDIWGVWNTSGIEYATLITSLSTGSYLYDIDDGGRLTFHENYYNDGPRISYQGGHYKLIKLLAMIII